MVPKGKVYKFFQGCYARDETQICLKEGCDVVKVMLIQKTDWQAGQQFEISRRNSLAIPPTHALILPSFCGRRGMVGNRHPGIYV
jgi:hypothetical protein